MNSPSQKAHKELRGGYSNLIVANASGDTQNPKSSLSEISSARSSQSEILILQDLKKGLGPVDGFLFQILLYTSKQILNNLYQHLPKGCQMVPKGCQFNMP